LTPADAAWTWQNLPAQSLVLVLPRWLRYQASPAL
jgi:hypothetical protein